MSNTKCLYCHGNGRLNYKYHFKLNNISGAAKSAIKPHQLQLCTVTGACKNQ